MTIRHSIQQINGAYTVTFQLDSGATDGGLTAVERQKIAEYGHFLVDIGGTIDPSAGANLVLGDDERRFPAALPFSKSFAVADYDNAKELAVAYEAHVLAEVETAKDTFMAQESFNTTNVTTL